jgi:DNA-binding transcriptional regulator YiaG
MINQQLAINDNNNLDLSAGERLLPGRSKVTLYNLPADMLLKILAHTNAVTVTAFFLTCKSTAYYSNANAFISIRNALFYSKKLTESIRVDEMELSIAREGYGLNTSRFADEIDRDKAELAFHNNFIKAIRD